MTNVVRSRLSSAVADNAASKETATKSSPALTAKGVSAWRSCGSRLGQDEAHPPSEAERTSKARMQ